MYNIVETGLTSAFYSAVELLLKEGVQVKTRENKAGSSAFQLSEPICIEIKKPRLRHIFLAERNWNKTLPYVESLWLALGWNNLDDLPGKYVKSLYSFSDDGRTWRAGYGPRIRHFTGSYDQYNIGRDFGEDTQIFGKVDNGIDQLKYVVESFKRDRNTRQADITIHDPAKDCFVNNELIITKDTPCTRSLHFQKNPAGFLDLVVRMRSNDVLWGFSAVNVFNFTLMQEYVSMLTGIPIGTYYHIADNFHYYSNFRGTLEKIVSYKKEYIATTEKNFLDLLSDNLVFKQMSLKDFDGLIRLIHEVEEGTYSSSEEGLKKAEAAMSKLRKGPILFNDWAAIIALRNLKTNKTLKNVKSGLYEIKDQYMKKFYTEY